MLAILFPYIHDHRVLDVVPLFVGETRLVLLQLSLSLFKFDALMAIAADAHFLVVCQLWKGQLLLGALVANGCSALATVMLTVH